MYLSEEEEGGMLKEEAEFCRYVISRGVGVCEFEVFVLLICVKRAMNDPCAAR